MDCIATVWCWRINQAPSQCKNRVYQQWFNAGARREVGCWPSKKNFSYQGSNLRHILWSLSFYVEVCSHQFSMFHFSMVTITTYCRRPVIDMPIQQNLRYHCDTMNLWLSICPTNRETYKAVTLVKSPYRASPLSLSFTVATTEFYYMLDFKLLSLMWVCLEVFPWL